MPRLAIANMILGFSMVFIAAAAGSFIGLTITQNQVSGITVDSWAMILQRSAHGHFNLFGYLHILFALTLPYARLTERIQLLQTTGLALGSLAIGPGLIWRSLLPPSRDFDFATVLVGGGLSCALVAIAVHIYGLSCKWAQRS